jgi:hypothetical protein
MGQHGSQNGTISDLQLPPAQSGLELSSQDTFPSPNPPKGSFPAPRPRLQLSSQDTFPRQVGLGKVSGAGRPRTEAVPGKLGWGKVEA